MDLLVVWRGAPGWWIRTSYDSRDAGTAGKTVRRTTRIGEWALKIEFDVPLRTVSVQDRALALDGANVILVDGVDQRLPRIATLTIDASMPDTKQVNVAVRRSSSLQAFLRCGETLAETRMQQYVATVCAQMTGK